jgi:hypothetical protein
VLQRGIFFSKILSIGLGLRTKDDISIQTEAVAVSGLSEIMSADEPAINKMDSVEGR